MKRAAVAVAFSIGVYLGVSIALFFREQRRP